MASQKILHSHISLPFFKFGTHTHTHKNQTFLCVEYVLILFVIEMNLQYKNAVSRCQERSLNALKTANFQFWTGGFTPFGPPREALPFLSTPAWFFLHLPSLTHVMRFHFRLCKVYEYMYFFSSCICVMFDARFSSQNNPPECTKLHRFAPLIKKIFWRGRGCILPAQIGSAIRALKLLPPSPKS